PARACSPTGPRASPPDGGPSADGGGANTARANAIEARPRREHRAIDIDATAGVLDHDDVEALALGVLARIANAKVEREPGQKDAPQAAFAQIPGQPGLGLAVVLVECRIRVDIAVITLAQHQLRLRDLQVAAKFRARRSLHAMVRPQDLRTVGYLDRFIGLAARMR